MDPEQLPLRDLHLPEPVGFWPPAPGWWLLMALAAAGLGWLMWRAWQHWRRNHARRVALAELRRVAAEHAVPGNEITLARALSALTRRAMLAYAPRDEVAGLTGERWLAWLDRGLSEPLFTKGPGRLLESLPYRDQLPADEAVDRDALVDVVRRRLATPLPEGRA